MLWGSGSNGSCSKKKKKYTRHDGSGQLELHLAQKHAKKPLQWGYYKCAKYRNNKVINEDRAVTFHVPNWVKSVNVELPDTNI